ncbi:hypothetical protein QRX60_03760 [Amycolatopsis mongoliensis]|uniref:Uncharacterized protein n=1 Tax=Amycolatopsis mongoliensis TaxID=715475 RepID=A0A9Y2JQV6_9PSEU|nr:hypothetical protein [Amycolatopsis sp. 4-36]WIY02998.1 hypothetical protein QRX60_03760 [Amycolatopsis sp. 4-36]
MGRVAVGGLVGLVCVLATIGALTRTADVLIGWILLGAGAGILVAFCAPRLARGRAAASGPDLRLGALTAAAFVTACLVVAGLLTTVGGGVTAALLVLLVVGGLGAARRRRPAPSAASGPPGVVVPHPPKPGPVADMATEELCAAWRRSYFLLALASGGPAHRLVVQRRQDFLDELERRDRSGFLRWLDSGAEAGSDPGPYLTTRS